jgi:predicted Rdx family selenoprotein
VRDLIAEKFDAEFTVVEGGMGVFDIAVDCDIVFSKRTSGWFPEAADIVALGRSETWARNLLSADPVGSKLY